MEWEYLLFTARQGLTRPAHRTRGDQAVYLEQRDSPTMLTWDATPQQPGRTNRAQARPRLTHLLGFLRATSRRNARAANRAAAVSAIGLACTGIKELLLALVDPPLQLHRAHLRRNPPQSQGHRRPPQRDGNSVCCGWDAAERSHLDLALAVDWLYIAC
jgi:hypothetical protein